MSFTTTGNDNHTDLMVICMKQFNEKDYVIVSDFDGTITREDSNALLAEVCGNAENAQIEIDFIGGLISNREAFERHFKAMRISIEDYKEFIKSNITIDPAFDVFLEKVHKLGVSLYIVSAGFRQAVESVMGKERLSGIEVFANELSGEPYIMPTFASKNPVCVKPYGPCGNCKRDCLKIIKRKSGKKILYIGDGITDRCAVDEADLLYAKDSLAEYCDINRLPYLPFVDFKDVINNLGWGAV
jgi:2-hydroxy-3-keto-5-methylthiopentenyl-1-phosphate phosphatase